MNDWGWDAVAPANAAMQKQQQQQKQQHQLLEALPVCR
jgi:hypothetical protein